MMPLAHQRCTGACWSKGMVMNDDDCGADLFCGIEVDNRKSFFVLAWYWDLGRVVLVGSTILYNIYS